MTTTTQTIEQEIMASDDPCRWSVVIPEEGAAGQPWEPLVGDYVLEGPDAQREWSLYTPDVWLILTFCGPHVSAAVIHKCGGRAVYQADTPRDVQWPVRAVGHGVGMPPAIIIEPINL